MLNDLFEYFKSSHTIVSGGQTGADQAGLEAARTLKYKTGGWAPNGWETMEGPQKELLQSYGLKEHAGGYRPRTIQNVRDSDFTIIISRAWKSPGTILTINACVRERKPFIALHETGKVYQSSTNLLDSRYIDKLKLDEITEEEKLYDFYASILRNYLIINCAGNAENNAPGITSTSFNIFYNIFKKMYPEK